MFFKMMLFYNISLFVLFFFDTALQLDVKKLDLFEGDICRKDHGTKHQEGNKEYICERAENCKSLANSIKNQIYPDICSFDGSHPIVCCPPKYDELPSTNAEITEEKISVLKEVCETQPEEPVYGNIDEDAQPMEFKHMTLIGYGENTKEVEWACGGSLISKRWILTAAHCKKTNNGLARWVRLGNLTTDRVIGPNDYQIVEHVIHPKYEPPSIYNDIALFKMNKDVKYDIYVFPVCLNSDVSFTPSLLTASGWGNPSGAEHESGQSVLKATLEVFPAEKCNNSYFLLNRQEIEYGILDDKMICAGLANDQKDDCVGDSGGPIQTKEHDLECSLHLMIGITSFGRLCGEDEFLGVYTKVAYYYQWIDSIVLD